MNIRHLTLGCLLLAMPVLCSLALPQVEAQAQKEPANPQEVPVIPAPEAIIKVELFPDVNAISGHGAKLDDKKFKSLLRKAKLLSPAEAKEIGKQWQYAPYYYGTFTTKHGAYSFSLFLGGLGIITPPSQSERTFTFEQPQ